MKSLRPVLYLCGAAAVLICLYVAGLFPAGLSASEQLAADWEASYGSRAKVDDDGRVLQLTIRSADFADADCARLTSMPDLESLDLSGTSITNDSLATLAQLKSLRTLKLSGTVVTDAGLAALAEAPALEDLSLARCPLDTLTESGVGQLVSLTSLDLMDTQITDDAGAALSKLTNLQKLYVGRTKISSSILPALTDLKKIQLLNVAELPVTAAGDMEAIASLPALELLYLDRSDLTDEAFQRMIAALCSHESCVVSAMFLEGCAISDASQEALLDLVQLSSMSKLRLTGTQVSREVFNELVKTSPEISFAHGSGQSED